MIGIKYGKITVLLAVIGFLFTLRPLMAMSNERTYSLGYINMATTRGGDYADRVYNYSYLRAKNSYLPSSNNVWNSYFQLDFSECAKLMKNPDAISEIHFNFWGGNYNNASSSAYNHDIYALHNSTDAYERGELSFNEAERLGLNEIDSDMLVAQRLETSATNIAYTCISNTPQQIKALTDAFNSGYDNCIVTFAYKSSADNNSCSDTSRSQTIIYYDNELLPSDDEFVIDIKSEMTWEKLFGDAKKDAVTEALKLPDKYYGADIEWSSVDGVVDGGKICQKENTITANLTASIKYNTSSKQTIVFENVTILGTAPSETAVTAEIPASETAQIYGGSPALAASLFPDDSVLKLASLSVGDANDAHGFIKWDLSGYLSELDAARSLSLEFTNDSPATGAKDAVLTLLNDNFDTWKSDSLTYSEAVKCGMYFDEGLCTLSDINLSCGNISVNAPELLTAVKEAVAQNPDDATISFRFSSADSSGGYLSMNTKAPFLKLTYFDSEVKSDEEYRAEKAKSMPWRAISMQDINNVTADLALPSSWYGYDVSWQSSDESVIGTDGKVTPASTDTEVILTPSINSKELIPFVITVPAKSIAVKSVLMYSSPVSDLNYTIAYIFSNKVINAGDCVIFIATYKDSELINIKTVSDISLEKGMNIVSSDNHAEFSGVTSKVIVVDNMTGLAPLASIQ